MFWNRFEELCRMSGKKPSPVGKEIGVSATAVYKWKEGTIPNGEILMKIADYFHVSVDYLLGRTDEPTQITGHINGDNSIQTIQDSPVINHQALTEYKQDSVTSEFIKIFEDLNFDDKVELMGLAVKMRKGV